MMREKGMELGRKVRRETGGVRSLSGTSKVQFVHQRHWQILSALEQASPRCAVILNLGSLISP